MMMSRDFAGGFAAILLGAVYLYFSYQISASALDDALGPAGVPRAYGWLMIALGVIVGGSTVLSRLRSKGADTGSAGEWAGQGRKTLRAAGLLLIGILYLLLVGALGYALSIALLIVAVAIYQGARADWKTAAVGGGGALFLWAVFVLLLDVSMPEGILGLI